MLVSWSVIHFLLNIIHIIAVSCCLCNLREEEQSKKLLANQENEFYDDNVASKAGDDLDEAKIADQSIPGVEMKHNVENNENHQNSKSPNVDKPAFYENIERVINQELMLNEEKKNDQVENRLKKLEKRMGAVEQIAL